MERIKALILEIQPDVDFDGDLISDGYLDSLDVIKLVTLLETSFGISIPGAAIDPENFRNLEAIDRLVTKYKP